MSVEGVFGFGIVDMATDFAKILNAYGIGVFDPNTPDLNTITVQFDSGKANMISVWDDGLYRKIVKHLAQGYELRRLGFEFISPTRVGAIVLADRVNSLMHEEVFYSVDDNRKYVVFGKSMSNPQKLDNGLWKVTSSYKTRVTR